MNASTRPLDLTASAAVAPSGGRFHARVRSDWREACEAWGRLRTTTATPFQGPRWLSSWYTTLGRRVGVTPLFVEVDDAAGRPAMALPLVRVATGGPTTIEFADLGITDYNMPLLGPAAPRDDAEAAAAWRAVRAVLPPADLLVFTKMPEAIGGARNPLVGALRTTPSNLNGNVVTVGEDVEAWADGLQRHYRKEFRRYWRVFSREPEARFMRARSVDEAMPLLERIEALQNERFRNAEATYLLGDVDYRDFYRDMLRRGVDEGSIVVTALMVGDRMVAGLYGIAEGDTCALVRIASVDGQEAKCSPGRLLIERTIRALHGEGLRTFDLTIGNYLHKRCFSAERLPLVDATAALSLRGMPRTGLWRAKSFVKAHPGRERLIRDLLGAASRWMRPSTDRSE